VLKESQHGVPCHAISEEKWGFVKASEQRPLHLGSLSVVEQQYNPDALASLIHFLFVLLG